MTESSTENRYNPDALARLIERFTQGFGTFESSRYDAFERSYKVQAAEHLHASVSQDQLHALIAQGEMEQAKTAITRIAQRSYAVPSKRITLLNQWDTQPLRETDAAVLVPPFADLLYGTAPFAQRFDAWVEVLSRIEPNCWPAATLFLMLANPQEHIFVKANPFRTFLKAIESPLRWEAQPTAATYVQLQHLARALLDDLRHLGAQDMIDVQSFIWQAQPQYNFAAE
jgi:hypothetical protein